MEFLHASRHWERDTYKFNEREVVSFVLVKLMLYQTGGFMDDKTITAISTSLALMQIQVNALLLLLDQQHPTAGVRAHFQELVSEGVQAVGLETMEGIKTRIREGMLQQWKTEPGSNGKGQA
jgi:hypothetical protein